METEISAVKQIIVIRRGYGGIKLRRGKEIAQGAHASMAWLTRRLRAHPKASNFMEAHLSKAELAWIEGLFTKIVVQVPDEIALRAIYAKALDANLEAHLIEDAGLTEFKGVKTATAVAVGPDFDYLIDPVCAGLELY